MEYKIGICDEDYHYVVNLMEYVNSQRIGGIYLVAFSSIGAVEEYLEKNYLDGVLVGQDISVSKEFFDTYAGVIVVPLTGDRTLDAGKVYKYQSAQLVIRSVLEKLNVSLCPQPVVGKSFYAVYSPLGRCGKTTLAKGLGVNHKGTLYVGLEEFENRDSLGEEILYHIIFQNSNIKELLDKIMPNQYGLREIKGILSYMDIRQLSKENMEWLKSQLLIGTDYDRVVFDIGSAVLSDLNVLDVMDRIYVPVLEEEESKVKLQAFREVLRCSQYRGIGKKLQYLNVPICHYASEMMTDYIRKGEL